jgi:hypothetical protein
MGGEGIVKRFFTDQGDGSAKAYVRFGDGQVVQLTATNPGGVTLTTGKRLSTTRLVISGNPPPYYYVPEGGTATVDQVLIPGIGLGGAFGATPGALMQLGRLLCSTSSSLIGDSEFNVFPEGVGLGLNNLFDKVSLRVPLAYEVPRFFVVDRDMTFSDVFMAIAKEYGLMLVWSPADGLLTLRRLMLPSGAAVGTSPAINDTNRAQPGDITRTTRDKSFLRSGFKFKWGWDGGAQKFAGPEISFVDNFARDAYQASDRVETYEDKTMAVGALADPGVVLEAIMARNIFTRVVWARIQRSTSRRLMLESPGTYHQIIDGTIPNPFTGSMGITAADGIYGLLFETSSKGASGDGTVMPGVPVPDNGTTTTLLSEPIVRSAVDRAEAAGWNVTATVAVAPPASTLVEGAAAANALAPSPPTAGGLSVTELKSRFLIVTFNDRAVPIGAEPKSRLGGATASTTSCGVLGAINWKSVALSSESCSAIDAPPGFRS